MKQLIISVALMSCSLIGFSQIVNVKSIDRIYTPVSVDQAEISPDGKFVISSTNEDRSLMRIDLSNGEAKKVTDNGTTYLMQFTPDSKSVVYVAQTTDENHLQYKQVRSIDLASGKDVQLVAPTRTLNGVKVDKTNVVSVSDGRARARSVKDDAQPVAKSTPVPYIYYGQLMIDIDGEKIALNPNGKEGESYIWPSLSPDGTKVLYYWVGSGAWVCDLDGSNAHRLLDIRAPRWIDDSTIVGMDDLDDGRMYIASDIVVADLNGAMQRIPVKSAIAMFPSVSADGSKIACSTPNGELYIINITR